MTFKELNLSAPLLRAVQEAGYETPSPIQAAAIPPVLAGRDLMGCAQTGTGKTAAFALPMLDRLTANAPRRKGAVRALILTPTRELALQIGESFEAYGKYLKLRSTVIFGGVGQAPQVEALKKGVDILIACPGRLNDLIGQGFIDLSALEIFVLDEADRMLDMGFVHDVKKVIAKLPGFRFDNRGRMSGAEAIVVETSTEGVEGRGLSFDFSFLAGNHDINRSWGYPVEWKVEYSADGLPFIDAGRIFVLRPVVYNDAVIKDLGLRRLSYDAALGFAEYSVPLPVSLLGHKRLTVRLTPASAVMATIPENPADDSAGGVVTADFRQPFVLRLGRVRYRKTILKR